MRLVTALFPHAETSAQAETNNPTRPCLPQSIFELEHGDDGLERHENEPMVDH